MPNGMSGCFRLSKQELREWLVSFGPSQEVGYTLSVQRRTEGERQVSARSPADATTVLDMLAEFKSDDVLGEKQDRSYYVIHLDADDHVDGRKWIEDVCRMAGHRAGVQFACTQRTTARG